MSDQGYQNFFRAAKAAQKHAAPPGPTARLAKRTPARPAKQREDTEHRMRRAVGGQTKRRAPFPIKAVVGFAVCLSLAGAYVFSPETFESLIERIEVRAIGGARASTEAPAEKPPVAANVPAKAAEGAAGAAHDEGKAGEGKVSTDVNQFDKLKQRKEELDRREKELAELEEELQRQKGELDQRIQALEATRGQIAQILKERVEVDQEKVNKLVDLYSNMKAKQAADVIGTLNEDLAVEVLAKMKKKNAAAVMDLLSADKARVLSEKYTGFQRAHGQVSSGGNSAGNSNGKETGK